MKVSGNGQGKILSQEELKRLFTEGLLTQRDRLRRALAPSLSVWHLLVHWLSRIGSFGSQKD
ncbi:hypothetical protein [Anabaena sp. CCY 0017]|uniref:hypothetical protein n=1 Tax=Anabaena sp. CCY 0017 TaxID=3103866 RepID=UPI0039C610DA